ncbi:MAG: purine-nucleoside phosphorylase [Chthoniobacterales bacterium]
METFAVERVRDYGAQIAIVLGSGLSSLVEKPSLTRTISYQEITDVPRSSVKGHIGRFVLGGIGQTRVIFAQGRVHLYEGFSAKEITAGIRFLSRAGVKRLILTNAAGSMNPDFLPGSWMILTDHLNLTGTSPLSGGAEFIDMTETYSATWRDSFSAAAREKELTLREGVYAGMRGPQYETPAEVRMLRTLGADSVGMSTICEAIQARALGMEVAGFSCLTNWAAGLNKATLSHGEVLATGISSAGSFRTLLESVL